MQNESKEERKLWDAADVAAYMKVSRSWIYMRVEAGLIPHIRIGNLIRFEPETLKEFLNRERLSATGAAARVRAVRVHHAG